MKTFYNNLSKDNKEIVDGTLSFIVVAAALLGMVALMCPGTWN